MARPKNRRQQHQYRPTATPKKEVKPPSSPWYVAAMLGLMLVGGLLIILNYIGVFGGSFGIPLVGGLVLIGAGFLMTLNFH